MKKAIKKFSALLILSSMFLAGCNFDFVDSILDPDNYTPHTSQGEGENQGQEGEGGEGGGGEVTPEEILVTSISLQSSLSLKQGARTKLDYSVVPSNATIKEVGWASSDENIVSVDQEGNIEALAGGTATVICYAGDNSGVQAECVVTVTASTVKATSVNLDFHELKLNTGGSHTLSASVLPASTSNKAVTWKTSSSKIATVSNTGKVTAYGEGTCTITVTTADGSNKTDTCTITVKTEVVDVESVTLNKTSTEIGVGQTEILSVSVLPTNASNKGVTWTSSSSTIASVSSSGLVTAKKVGECDITVKSKADTSISATCHVTVKPVSVTGVSLDEEEFDLGQGKSKTLTASVLPSNATDKSVSWSTSNSSVASVSSSGVVTAKAIGSATITATTTDGGFTASATINVVESSGLDDSTLLVYMCGADLESDNSFATADIKEMLSVSGQPDDVNIVIQTGGAKSWHYTGVDASGNSVSIQYNKSQRWHIENKKLVNDTTSSSVNMGASSSLQSFLEYGLKEYPADRVSLILWNHGGGIDGVCYDENNSNDSLTTVEVNTAVKNALKNTGHEGEKLEWIGYDACLMDVQDIAINNSTYFNYMIASEESEAGEGWAYSSWIDDFYAKKSTVDYLKACCDGFKASTDELYQQYGEKSDQTLAVLDLSKASTYKDAWEDMTSALKTKITSSNKSSFVSLVEGSKAFSAETDGGITYNYYYGLYDAKDFVNRLAKNSTFNPGSTYTNAVLNAHSQLVTYSIKGAGAGNAYGLALYWGGYQDSYYNLKSTYNATGTTSLTNWKELVNTYGYSHQISSWY